MALILRQQTYLNGVGSFLLLTLLGELIVLLTALLAYEYLPLCAILAPYGSSVNGTELLVIYVDLSITLSVDFLPGTYPPSGFLPAPL